MSKERGLTGEFVVTSQDKATIDSLLKKIDDARQHSDRINVIERNNLPSLLSANEIAVIDRVYAINPTIYGFKGPKLALEPVPSNLVQIQQQSYTYQGKKCFTKIQYIPESTYQAFQIMADAMRNDINRSLLVEGSYRSNAYQAVVFLKILRLNDFDVAKTARRAAIPGYSEHGTPSRLALDLQNIDGLPSDETPQDFEGTKEYSWLLANAHQYRFFMSYPKNNPYGLMFEPWHWRHMPTY